MEDAMGEVFAVEACPPVCGDANPPMMAGYYFSTGRRTPGRL